MDSAASPCMVCSRPLRLAAKRSAERHAERSAVRPTRETLTHPHESSPAVAWTESTPAPGRLRALQCSAHRRSRCTMPVAPPLQTRHCPGAQGQCARERPSLTALDRAAAPRNCSFQRLSDSREGRVSARGATRYDRGVPEGSERAPRHRASSAGSPPPSDRARGRQHARPQ